MVFCLFCFVLFCLQQHSCPVMAPLLIATIRIPHQGNEGRQGLFFRWPFESLVYHGREDIQTGDWKCCLPCIHSQIIESNEHWYTTHILLLYHLGSIIECTEKLSSLNPINVCLSFIKALCCLFSQAHGTKEFSDVFLLCYVIRERWGKLTLNKWKEPNATRASLSTWEKELNHMKF